MNYPEPKHPETEEDFIEVLRSLIEEHPNEITLVTLGPLTNIGNFITKYPDSFLMLKNIVIMVQMKLFWLKILTLLSGKLAE